MKTTVLALLLVLPAVAGATPTRGVGPGYSWAFINSRMHLGSSANDYGRGGAGAAGSSSSSSGTSSLGTSSSSGSASGASCIRWNPYQQALHDARRIGGAPTQVMHKGELTWMVNGVYANDYR